VADAACAAGSTRATRASAPRTVRMLEPSLAVLEYKKEGHSYWRWDASGEPGGSRVHYLVSGPEGARPLVLVHGFGASWFHWRYNVPFLATKYRVYAVDMIGFGLSDKPLLQYSSELWANQLAAFIEEVVVPSAPCKVAIAGNSLGGFACLGAAVLCPELIEGVALLNAAGQFKPLAKMEAMAPADEEAGALGVWAAEFQQRFATLAQRAVLFASFTFTKQPARIKQVLGSVYSHDASNVDDALVESIAQAATHPNAAEVFYRIVSKTASSKVYLDDLLAELAPATELLLLWGESDPWIRPATADRIQRLRPAARRVSVDAGHCPHDEAPAACNSALGAWVDGLAGAPLVVPAEPMVVAARWSTRREAGPALAR